MPKPTIKVWLDDGSGTFSYDVTPYVDLGKGISITRGRQDGFGEVQPSTCSLTLDNSGGRFTWGSTLAPVQVDTPIYVETSIGASYTRRFTGYVNTWPLTWPGGNRYAEVQITASDRLARLARRKFRSVPAETIALVSPSAYYPLLEPSGSTSAGDASGHGAPALQTTQIGTGGTIDFGSGTGPATDGNAAPIFSRVDTANGQYLSAAIPNGIFTGGPNFYILAVVNTTEMGQTVVRLNSNNYPVELAIDPTTGRPYCNYGTGQVAASASIADGATHVLLFTWTDATNTGSLYVDNTLAATSTSYYGWPSRWTKVSIGGGDGATSKPAAATISHVAIGERTLSSAERTDLYTAMHDGFTADSSAERIIRYAGWAGIADTEIDAPAGDLASVAHQDTNGASPVAAMQNVATSEQGLLFISGGGRLTFRSRSSRYVPNIGATLVAQDIGVDTTFSLDTQTLINSVTASREGGATQVYEVASSVAKYEQYPTDLQLLVTTDDDALLAASWIANTNAEPTPRLSSVPVDLLTMDATKATNVMFLELGDAFTITGLPSQAPASSVSLFAEGWQEDISTDAWSITFNTSPLNTVWKLEDPLSGRIDSTFRLAY